MIETRHVTKNPQRECITLDRTRAFIAQEFGLFSYYPRDGGLLSYGPDVVDSFRPGRKAGRSSCAAADQVRDGREPQDRQGARSYGAAIDLAARRRGDRVSCQPAQVRRSIFTSRSSATGQNPSATLLPQRQLSPVADIPRCTRWSAVGQRTKSLRDSPLRGTSAATSSAQPVRTHPGTLH